MKKNYILSILTVVMLLPFTTVKAQYDAGDSSVCYNLMTNNFATSNLLNWNDPDPGNWLGVVWNTATPKRIIKLQLRGDGSNPRNWQRNDAWMVIHTFHTKYTQFDTTGVDCQLKGDIDLSALSELELIDVRRNDSLTGVNVSSLNNLEYFYAGQSDMIDSLDFSNLSNIIDIHVSSLDSLVYLNASNCPSLVKLKTGWSENLSEVIVSGSNNIHQIAIKSSSITALDLTGITELRRLALPDNSSLSTLTGLDSLSNLYALSLAKSNLDLTTINVLNFDTSKLHKFNVNDAKLESIENLLLIDTMTVIGINNNHLTLANAVQIHNFPGYIDNKLNYKGTDQIRHGGDTILAGGATSYPGEALIDINGVNVASTFTLFDTSGVQVGATNATGVFTFPLITDTGEYYLEMTNPGAAPANNSVLLTTNNFFVVLPILTGSVNNTICATGSIVVNGNTYNAATPTGTEIFTSVGPFNLDSTVTINLTVLPVLTGSVTSTICATGSIVINGNTYNAATPTGTEVFTVGPNNCDSTVTINLTVLTPIDISTTTSNNTISSNATGATYQWIDCSTNNSIAGETGQNFTATVDGDYAVVVTVGNCADTSACVNIATVGINELNNGNTVSVYPNPTTGSVSLNFGEVLNAGSVIITDITGKQVYVLENLNTQTLSIDVNHFSNGVYFVKIQNNNQLKVIKFIKQ